MINGFLEGNIHLLSFKQSKMLGNIHLLSFKQSKMLGKCTLLFTFYSSCQCGVVEVFFYFTAGSCVRTA